MSKDNTFSKKLKKQFLSINDSIENYFNKITPLTTKIKKLKFDPNSRAFLIFGLIIIFIFTLFSIPSFYDKNIIKAKIQNQIFEKYNFEIRFNENVNFSLLPKPHFVSKNFSIIKNKKEIANVGKFKAYISNENYFLFNDIKIKDLIFEKAEFNLNKKNINFFKKLISTNPSEDVILIKKSKLFYQNLLGDVLFISKINDSEFFYDYKKLENVLYSKNEIFNLPFILKIKNNYFNKQLSTNISSKKIRLGIENLLNYKNLKKDGIMNINLMNYSNKFNYRINKNSLFFNSEEENFYTGQIELKPFYLSSSFNYNNLNFKNFVNNKMVLIELINSEILNNENLNMDINLNIKDILNAGDLNTLFLKIGVIEGDINLSNSTLMWQDNLQIIFQECFLDINDNNINLIGTLNLEFQSIESFYSFYQVKKENRKEIQNLKIDFVYNLLNDNFSFYNPKINNNFNSDIEKFTEKFNSKKNRSFNKITFKKFVNDFFSFYAG